MKVESRHDSRRNSSNLLANGTLGFTKFPERGKNRIRFKRSVGGIPLEFATDFLLESLSYQSGEHAHRKTREVNTVAFLPTAGILRDLEGV